MQQQITQPAKTVVAPGPARHIVRNYWISCGVILAFSISSIFVPEPLRDELLWNKTSPFFHFINTIPWLSFILSLIWWATFIWPFINFPVTALPVQSKWKKLEKKRQLAVENRLRGVSTVTAPLPEVFSSLPRSLSVHICRNWRATLIGGAIYTPLLGLLLLLFVSDWPTNLQYLAQRGELSGWTVLEILLEFLTFCLIISPAITGFLFTPRQRLIATQNGLICQCRLRFSFIPWHEACLFAVIAEQNQTLVYELASTADLIRWSSKPAWNYGDTFPPATVGIAPLSLVCPKNSIEEYEWQIRQLTAMVATGTGLPLYDLREPVKQARKLREWF